MGSTRLPGKVLADIGGMPAIGHLLRRAGRARQVDALWLACSTAAADDPLADYVRGLGVSVFRGDEHDVLSRYAAVAAETRADVIVRLTGDCPLIDPAVIDAVVARFHSADVDFASNTLQRSYPDGLDVEVFGRDALARADREARDPFLREHVTPYIHGRHKERLPWGYFSHDQVVFEADFSHLRWTLDTAADLYFLRRLVERAGAKASWLTLLAASSQSPPLYHSVPAVPTAVRQPRTFEQSNRMFEQASRVIPLASQTFSKSHQQWVRGAAPLFLTRGDGCRVWDIDDNSYIDFVLGLLPVVLGYRDPDVDAAIRDQLNQGITFSLPHPLEAEVAARLVDLIPCADMVRFGKNGSDATTAAVRLARAHTGRDKVALCGYHGWHDWYIGTTTRGDGVPAPVRALSHVFPYNDPQALDDALAADPDGFAAVILEPVGVQTPAPGFLDHLRAVTARYGVVLIFDEIIAGCRAHMGGAQAVYGVTPDLAAFGKAMANGMPLSAVVGRRDIMMGMEEIFFSATFGGETLSLAAARATLDKLVRLDGPDRLARLGTDLADRANAHFAAHGLNEWLGIAGAAWWPRLAITAPPVPMNVMVSLLRQAFVANGLLLGASLNLSLAHDDTVVITHVDQAFNSACAQVRAALDSRDPATQVHGALVQPTFAVR